MWYLDWYSRKNKQKTWVVHKRFGLGLVQVVRGGFEFGCGWECMKLFGCFQRGQVFGNDCGSYLKGHCQSSFFLARATPIYKVDFHHGVVILRVFE